MTGRLARLGGCLLVCWLAVSACTSQPPLPTAVPSLPFAPSSTVQPGITPQPTATPTLAATSTVLPTATSKADPRSHWTSYTNPNFIRTLLVDRDGKLWAGGSGGVVAWELQAGTYTRYTSEDGLNGNSVNAIAQAPDGAMWFGTSSGAARFLNGAWTVFTQKDGLPAGEILAVAAAPDGTLWLGARDQVARFDGSQWITYPIPASALALAPDGSLWAGGSGKVAHFDGQAWTGQAYPPLRPAGFQITDQVVTAMTVDAQGTLWVGTDYALHRYNGRTWTSYNPWRDLPNIGITALSVDPAGAVWIGLGYQLGRTGIHPAVVSPGLYRFDGSAWTLYTTQNGLPDNEVRAIAWGPDGAGYFGYYALGISKLQGQAWSTLPAASGLLSNGLDRVAVTGSGEVWVGSADGLSLYSAGSWTSFQDFGGLSTDIQALLAAANGTVWAGVPGGLLRFDGQTWTEFPADTFPWSDALATLTGWPDGRLFLGGKHTAGFLQGTAWLPVPQLPAGENLVVARALPDGSLWAYGNGYPGGLYHFDGRAWSNLGQLLPSLSALAVAPDGTLWLGSSLAGLKRFDGKSWTSFSTADGLPSDSIRALAVSPDGSVWVGSDRGLVRYTGSTWTTLTAADGLADDLVLDIAAASDGSLWIATHAGLSHYVP